jgi:ribosomal protein S12 methylthiotransferase
LNLTRLTHTPVYFFPMLKRIDKSIHRGSLLGMARRTRKSITIGFVALGCPKNVVDSERMLAEIVEAGFLVAADPAQADVVVVNTCGFIEPAKVESLEAIQQAVDNKRAGTVRKVIVAGCLSQRLGRQLLDQAGGIDAVVTLEERDRIVSIIRKTLADDPAKVYGGALPTTMTDDRNRLRIGPAHSAYLRISEGCNHRCSFCTIPVIRGPFRSKPQELVLDEARELVRSGAVELNLIGQDTTRYGQDLKIENGLAKLLCDMQRIRDLVWIRLLYAYPTGITDELIATIAASEKIVRYLDIPIQHVNDEILKAMRRPDSNESLRHLVERLRAAMPDVVLRTTLIVGFPGETDKQFSELLDFLRDMQLDAVGAFTFFPEAGTPAASLPNQIPDQVKNARLDELMRTQQGIAFARNEARIGSRLTCLIDTVGDDDAVVGRYYGQAPEIDSVCMIGSRIGRLKRESRPLIPGEFVEGQVVGTEGYDLRVERI